VDYPLNQDNRNRDGRADRSGRRPWKMIAMGKNMEYLTSQ